MDTIGPVGNKDRQPVDDLLHAVTAEKPGKDYRSIQARYTEICDAFIDGLVDGTSGTSDLVRTLTAEC
jgi:hypothetical protein